jgi:hypothetical protein
VFRRLGAKPPAQPAPPPALRPVPAPSAPRQLLGFAEPVAATPPIEAFLPQAEEAAAPAIAERVETAALETAPDPEPDAEPEPKPEPAPAPPVQARVRELPSTPAQEPAQTARPQNLVGRLGRRLGDAAAPLTMPAPTVRTMPAPAARVVPTPAARDFTGPPSAPPQPAGDRGGRPSLPRNRRAYRRAKLPAEIEIAGVPCTLIDVSIGGFAASGVPPIEPNALVPVTIRLMIDGIEVGTQLSARIIYVTQGRSSGRFIDLNPSQMAFLRYIVTWRGESVGAVGTTTLLDAIAGGADRGFMPGTGERSEPDGKSRWWAGLIGKKVNPPR